MNMNSIISTTAKASTFGVIAIGVAATATALEYGAKAVWQRLDNGAKYDILQAQVNAFVLDSGSGQWTCTLGDKTLVISAEKAPKGTDLRQFIESRLKDNSCRARLPVRTLYGSAPE